MKLAMILLALPLYAQAVSLDNAKTKEIYSKAKAGDAQSQYELGLQYLEYRGPALKKNEKEAYSWLLKAANSGHIKAQTKLGEMFEVGRGVEQDTNQAVRWYKKAAEGGDQQAKRALEFLPYDDSVLDQSPLAEAERMYKAGEYKYAIVEYEKLAKESNAQAQYMYGRMHLNGQGIPRDYAIALEWTKKAADQGHVKAQYSMGLYYKNGWGVDKDYDAAAEWFRKAAALGDLDAADQLKIVAPPTRSAANSVSTTTATSTATTTAPPPKPPKPPKPPGPISPAMQN